LDVDHYPVAPAELELQQVHVFVRHGERTPVGVRMAGPPASIPEHWMMCKHARRFRAAVAGADAEAADAFLSMKKVVERADGSSSEGEW
jgi:acid phosphatase